MYSKSYGLKPSDSGISSLNGVSPVDQPELNLTSTSPVQVGNLSLLQPDTADSDTSKEELIAAVGDRINDEDSILHLALKAPTYEQLYMRSAELINFVSDNYQSENPLIIEALLDCIGPFLCKCPDTDVFLCLKLLKHNFPTVLMAIWDYFEAKNYFLLDSPLASNWRDIIAAGTTIISWMTFYSAECAKQVTSAGLFEKFLHSIDSTYISVGNCDGDDVKTEILENLCCNQYSCIRQCLDGAKPIFRQNRGMEKMLQLRDEAFRKDKFAHIYLNCLLCVAYTLSEDEGVLIDEETKSNLTKFACEQACVAVKEADRQAVSLSLSECIETLNILLVSDDRKRQLCADSALTDCIASAIDTNEEETELIALVRCLNLLTFIPEGKNRVASNQQLLKALEKLKSHRNKNVRKNAEGTLWNISGQRPVEVTTSINVEPSNISQQHVMISYDWNHQHIAAAINLQLKSLGYFTWMDIDRMSGSTLEAMATAVEQSAVIVVCFSQSYKNSPNCRKEAEYADSMAKPLVPIKTDPNYKADGWLGLMLGSKLYLKCESEEMIKSIMPKLISEIGNRGKLGQPPIGESNKPTTVLATDKISALTIEELKIKFERLGWEWLVEDLSGSEMALYHQVYQHSLYELLRTLKEDFNFEERKMRTQFANYVINMSKLCDR